MSISRAEKEKLRQAKRADIQKLLYERDLLVDQNESSTKVKTKESEISNAKKELEAIEALQERDSAFDTQIIVNGGNVAQINTGINSGNVTQNNNERIDFWSSVDYSSLEKEFSTLQSAMKKLAKTDEQDIAVGEIAKAKKATQGKNREKIIQALKSAGKWAFDIATKIGLTLATEALKIALGLK